MVENYLKNLVNHLQDQNIEFEDGLSNEEIARVQTTFNFIFPPDLKAFLQFALPISLGFPNWRSDSEEEMRSRLDWPADGICFDIEQNDFWLEEWGLKPANLSDACELARKEVVKAPTLIPIYSHRYIPDNPPLIGNPIFSIHQTDIIYYGYNLASYFVAEFKAPPPEWPPEFPRPIKFWDKLVS